MRLKTMKRVSVDGPENDRLRGWVMVADRSLKQRFCGALQGWITVDCLSRRIISSHSSKRPLAPASAGASDPCNQSCPAKDAMVEEDEQTAVMNASRTEPDTHQTDMYWLPQCLGIEWRERSSNKGTAG